MDTQHRLAALQCFIRGLVGLMAACIAGITCASDSLSGLTPIGAMRAGNADGTIPAWAPMQWSAAEFQQAIDRLESEKPVHIVRASSAEQHSPWLSPGLKALIKQYPDTFSVPVYPSHRNAQLPPWLLENAKKNHRDAKISANGEEVTFAWPGIPFPVPKTAKEAMWNHQLRWKGLFLKLDTIESVVNRNGQFSLIKDKLEVYSVYHNQDRPREITDWRYTYYLSYIQAPARLAGGAYLSYETMKPESNPRQAWMYVAGQRRMRRSPVMGYDAPTFTSDGLRMMDEIDIFNGAMDHYDWQLIGRQEMYVPYNNSRLRKALDDPELALTPGHVNAEYVRFEKHRVWVIEARLKPGKRHIYHRRTFYLDEDTWGILLVDIYDPDALLWRVSIRYAAHYPEIPLMLTALDAFHDLFKETYYMQAVPHGAVEHEMTPPPKGYFVPASVRQRLHR